MRHQTRFKIQYSKFRINALIFAKIIINFWILNSEFINSASNPIQNSKFKILLKKFLQSRRRPINIITNKANNDSAPMILYCKIFRGFWKLWLAKYKIHNFLPVFSQKLCILFGFNAESSNFEQNWQLWIRVWIGLILYFTKRKTLPLDFTG